MDYHGRMYARLVAWNATPWGRMACGAAAVLAGSAGYLLLNGLVPSRFDLTTPLDRAIPFLPWTFVIYMSVYVLPLAAAWRSPPEEYATLLVAAVPMLAVSYLAFLVLPSDYPRPDASLAGSWEGAYRWLHATDGPANTFPSLHVAVTVLAVRRARTWPDGGRWVVWAGLIALSTLTTKQHYLADVLAGGALAWACEAWAFRARPVPLPVR